MIRPMQWLRLKGFARGPLRRSSDRAERNLFVLTVVAACFAVPAAGLAGGLATPDVPPADAYLTQAVLVADAVAPPSLDEYTPPGPATAKATWRAPGGEPKSGEIKVERTAKAGSTVPVWTDNAGTVVGTPTAPGVAQARVIFAGVSGAVLWLLAVVVMYVLAGRALLRRRMRDWEDDWQQAERRWRNTAGPSD